MIIVDTNVVSEIMRPVPDPSVLAWIEVAGRLHTTAVTLAEISYGIARLPQGRRKEALRATAVGVFAEFDEVVLPFDADAARRYADIVSDRDAFGRPISAADAQIAAICVVHDATLATRNTDDFDATGVTLVDPWES